MAFVLEMFMTIVNAVGTEKYQIEVIKVDSMNNQDVIDQVTQTMQDNVEQVRVAAMAGGYRAACALVMNVIEPWRKPHASHNDFKRIFKQLERMCSTPLQEEKANGSKTN